MSANTDRQVCTSACILKHYTVYSCIPEIYSSHSNGSIVFVVAYRQALKLFKECNALL